jgi:hypothetical protein
MFNVSGNATQPIPEEGLEKSKIAKHRSIMVLQFSRISGNTVFTTDSYDGAIIRVFDVKLTINGTNITANRAGAILASPAQGVSVTLDGELHMKNVVAADIFSQSSIVCNT